MVARSPLHFTFNYAQNISNDIQKTPTVGWPTYFFGFNAQLLGITVEIVRLNLQN